MPNYGIKIQNADDDIILSTEESNSYLWVDNYGTQKRWGDDGVIVNSATDNGGIYGRYQTLTLPAITSSQTGAASHELFFIHIPANSIHDWNSASNSAGWGHFMGTSDQGGAMIIGTHAHGTIATTPASPASYSGGGGYKWMCPTIMSNLSGGSGKVVYNPVIANAGSGYASYNGTLGATVASPTNGSTALVSITKSGNVINSITLDHEGFGYTSTPTITTLTYDAWSNSLVGTNPLFTTYCSNSGHRYYRGYESDGSTISSTPPTHTSGTANGWIHQGQDAVFTCATEYPYGLNVYDSTGNNLQWTSLAQGHIDIIAMGLWSSIDKYLDLTFTDGEDYYVSTLGHMSRQYAGIYGNRGAEFYYGSDGNTGGGNCRIRLFTMGDYTGNWQNNPPAWTHFTSQSTKHNKENWANLWVTNNCWMIAKRRF